MYGDALGIVQDKPVPQSLLQDQILEEALRDGFVMGDIWDNEHALKGTNREKSCWGRCTVVRFMVTNRVWWRLLVCSGSFWRRGLCSWCHMIVSRVVLFGFYTTLRLFSRLSEDRSSADCGADLAVAAVGFSGGPVRSLRHPDVGGRNAHREKSIPVYDGHPPYRRLRDVLYPDGCR